MESLMEGNSGVQMTQEELEEGQESKVEEKTLEPSGDTIDDNDHEEVIHEPTLTTCACISTKTLAWVLRVGVILLDGVYVSFSIFYAASGLLVRHEKTFACSPQGATRSQVLAFTQAHKPKHFPPFDVWGPFFDPKQPRVCFEAESSVNGSLVAFTRASALVHRVSVQFETFPSTNIVVCGLYLILGFVVLVLCGWHLKYLFEDCTGRESRTTSKKESSSIQGCADECIRRSVRCARLLRKFDEFLTWANRIGSFPWMCRLFAFECMEILLQSFNVLLLGGYLISIGNPGQLVLSAPDWRIMGMTAAIATNGMAAGLIWLWYGLLCHKMHPKLFYGMLTIIDVISDASYFILPVVFVLRSQQKNSSFEGIAGSLHRTQFIAIASSLFPFSSSTYTLMSRYQELRELSADTQDVNTQDDVEYLSDGNYKWINKRYCAGGIGVMLIAGSIIFICLVSTHLNHAEQICRDPPPQLLESHSELRFWTYCSVQRHVFFRNPPCECRRFVFDSESVAGIGLDLRTQMETCGTRQKYIGHIFEHWRQLEVVSIHLDICTTIPRNLSSQVPFVFSWPHFGASFLRALRLRMVHTYHPGMAAWTLMQLHESFMPRRRAASRDSSEADMWLAVGDWKQLDHLRIENPPIITRLDPVCDLTKLVVLDLQWSNITVQVLPLCFANLSHLEDLSLNRELTGTRFWSIPNEVFDLTALTSLRLWYASFPAWQLVSVPRLGGNLTRISLFGSEACKTFHDTYCSNGSLSVANDTVRRLCKIGACLSAPKRFQRALCLYYCDVNRIEENSCLGGCNNPQCNFLDGWCAIGCNMSRCPLHKWGNGICDSECMTQECGWDFGDCWARVVLGVSANESCSAGCTGRMVNDGVCDSACLNGNCRWDGYDCRICDGDLTLCGLVIGFGDSANVHQIMDPRFMAVFRNMTHKRRIDVVRALLKSSFPGATPDKKFVCGGGTWGLIQVAQVVNYTNCDQMFSAMDRNKDGLASYVEMMLFMAPHLRLIPKYASLTEQKILGMDCSFCVVRMLENKILN